MNQRISEQLDKILALADSSHDSEAVVAVRKARQMLTRDGLNFSDLARAAAAQTYGKSSQRFSYQLEQHDQTESYIHHLCQQLEDLRAQMQTQDLQLDFWRRRAIDFEKNAQHEHSEAERWKKWAHDTVNRLRNIGEAVGGKDYITDEITHESSQPSVADALKK